MINPLTDQLIHAFMRMKKTHAMLPPENDLRFAEMFVLTKIEDNKNEANACIHVNDIAKQLHITKPAVSQVLNALERKGYVVREIDKTDRRKISVLLTSEGAKTLLQSRAYMDNLINLVITRFGEEKTRTLISLFEELLCITEVIQKENTLTKEE